MGRSERRQMVVAVCALVLGLCAAGQGAIIYVDDNAGGANDGSCWTDAFAHLQDALAVALPGDEVRVAQGIYKPDQGAGQSLGDQAAAFQLVGGTVLRGGYAGLGAADPDERDVQLYHTVLSGDLSGDDTEVQHAYELVGEPARADNSEHIVRILGARTEVMLGGFCVTAATQTAIECEDASVVASDCVFTLNGAGDDGGAIYSHGGDLVLEQCTFTSNWAPAQGGAVFADSGCSVTMTACSFTGNCAGGGGAAAFKYGEVTMAGCAFELNTARGPGAVFCMAGTLHARDCTFRRNSTLLPNSARTTGSFATGAGGGALGLINTRGGGSEATVADCLFEGNLARTGGAINSDGGTVLHDCVFSGNRADEAGAIYGYFVGSFRNCVFAGNRANTGGAAGLRCSSHTAREFINCTFFANRAGDGNAIKHDRCSSVGSREPIRMANCIVWDGAAEFATAVDDQSIAIEITFSDVLGGWPGVGNIDVDPCFVDPGHWDPNGTPEKPEDDFWVGGDYHLKSHAGRWDPVTLTWVRDAVTSPCLDAGDPNTPIGSEPFPTGGFVNLGAYGGTAQASKSYFGGPVCETQIAGDINGDCAVDQADIEILMVHWLRRADFAPTLAITSPGDGTEITYPDPIVFQIDACDPDQVIRRIELTVESFPGGGHSLSGSSVMAGTTHWEFEWNWSRVREDGVYVIGAAVTDDEGVRTVAPKIRVILHPPD